MLQKLFSQHPQWPVVEKIACGLWAQGHRVVLAGGSVRDALMGKMAQDLDIATDATPEQVGSCFEKVLYIGKNFGVCRVVEEGVSIEVATFREESDYRDGRHPEKVVYATLEQDALRRDFTVNAMYFDLKTQELIDLVGGQKDLKARRLVTVGEPEKRFGEDLLRILRAARFAAQLDFSLDPRTQQAMTPLVSQLHKISRERIQDEFQKAFKSQKPFLFFEILQATHALSALIADLKWQESVVLNGASRSVAQVMAAFFASAVPSPSLGWAALLWLKQKTAGPSPSGTDWLKTWKLSVAVMDEATMLVQGEMALLKPDQGFDFFLQAMRMGLRKPFEDFWSRMESVFAAPRVLPIWQDLCRRYLVAGSLPTPLVTGKDLLALGMTQGTQFKTLLDKAYRLQLEQPQASKENLLKSIQN